MCRNRHRIEYDFLLILYETDNIVPSLLLKNVLKKILRLSRPKNSLYSSWKKTEEGFMIDYYKFPLQRKGEVGN